MLLFLLIYGLLPGQITMEQVEQYKQEVSVFAESFNMHGPGAVGDNLEKGTHTFPDFLKVCVLCENDCKFNNNLKIYKKCKTIY